MDRVQMIRIAAGLLVGASLGASLGYVGKCSTGTCPLTANPLRGALFCGVLGVLFSLSLAPAPACGPTGALVRGAEEVQAGQSSLHITSMEEFEQRVLGAGIPVLADLYSDSCGPCRALGPVIEGLARTYQGRAVVAKVSLDRLPQLAGRYGITAIPAVVFFSKGTEVDRLIGLRSEGDYAKALDRLIGSE